MKRILSCFTYTFLLIIISTVSCQTNMDCTGPEALNYVENAEMDDGNCEYARDKFLGEYSASVLSDPIGALRTYRLIFPLILIPWINPGSGYLQSRFLTLFKIY